MQATQALFLSIAIEPAQQPEPHAESYKLQGQQHSQGRDIKARRNIRSQERHSAWTRSWSHVAQECIEYIEEIEEIEEIYEE